MLYHRAIGEAWTEAVAPLRQQFGIDIVGRSRKNKIVLERDFVIEELTDNDRKYIYKQTENSFTQPNARVCEKMYFRSLTVSSSITKSRSRTILFLRERPTISIPNC